MWSPATVANPQLSEPELTIAADSFLLQPGYRNLLEYRKRMREIRQCLREHKTLGNEYIPEFIRLNPENYTVYDLAGDYCRMFGTREQAVGYWKQALTKEIPKLGERQAIEKKIMNINE